MNYLHPDNQGKPWVDWRDPKLCEDLFFKWFNWRLSGRTIDHFNWNLAYMETSKSPTGKPMTRAQKLWYSYLFGTTYHSSMAWTFYWHFPDPMNLDMKEVDEWVRGTFKHHRFNTDARYNKGHNIKMWRSFQDWVDRRGQGSVEAAFDSCLGDTEVESFHNTTQELRSLHKYGRMTAWLCSQCLWEGAKFPITPDTMFTDDPSNQSVWNGMCYFRGEIEKTVGKPPKYAGYKPTASDRQMFKNFERELMAQCRDKVADQEFLSYFTLETHLCQFKKIYVGADYPGQGVAQALGWYYDLKESFPEVDYSAFADRINAPDHFEAIRWFRRSGSLMSLMRETGQLIFMHDLFPELPDMRKEMGLSRKFFEDAPSEHVVKERIQTYREAVEGNWLSQEVLKGAY